MSKNSLTEELGELKVEEFQLPQSIAETGEDLQFNKNETLSLESVVAPDKQEICDLIDQLENSNKHMSLPAEFMTEKNEFEATLMEELNRVKGELKHKQLQKKNVKTLNEAMKKKGICQLGM